jgi:hypothetical protein
MLQESTPARHDPKMDIVVERIRNLQIISGRLLRITVASLPFLIVILLLADWLVGSRVFAGDLLRLSTVLTVAVEVFVLNWLFRKLPESLELIWTRNLLFASGDSEQQGQEFKKFIQAFERSLNSRWAWSLGVGGAVIGFASTYPVRFFLQAHTNPFDTTGWFEYYFVGHWAIVAIPLGYVLGVLIWRVGMIAVYISKLGRHFEIRIQPNHPDQCGGLRPIGNLCLIIALLLLVPAIFLSIWGFATYFFTDSKVIDVLWSAMYRQGLVLLSISALIAFLWPLYSIHSQMQKQYREIQAELDDLAQRIDGLTAELRTQAYTLTPAQGEEKLKSLEFMEKVYRENSRIPVWPIDWRTMLKFSSAQVVPILALLGTSDPVIKVVGSVITSTVK